MTEAYVTLATTDGYGVGALVLAHSLLSQGTTRQLCILVTPGVTEPVRAALAEVYNSVVMVDVLDSNDTAHLALLERPELGVTFTKLHCWTLTQYTKCVFLDADILALANSDELFSQPELSAACDVGWPDCFNSGMFVFVPCKDTYDRLLQFAKTTGSFDGGDQGLLNSFFPSWNRLSFVYNMVASAAYTYLPAFKQFGKGVKLVHFLGSTKPWHGESSGTSGYSSFVQAWWTIYRQLVQPSLPQEEEPPAPPHPPHHQQHDQQQQPHQSSQEPVAYQPPVEYLDSSCTWSHSDPRQSATGDNEVIVSGDDLSERVEGSLPESGQQPQAPSHNAGACAAPCTAAMSPPEQRPQATPVATDTAVQSHSPHSAVPPHSAVQPLSAVPPHSAVQPHSAVPPRSVSPPRSVAPASTVKVDAAPSAAASFSSSSYSARGQASSIPNPVAGSNSSDTRSVRASAPTLAAMYRSRSLPPSADPPPAAAAKVDPVSRAVELAQHLSSLSLSEGLVEGRQRWEAGQPEYLGRDSFDNILAYIQSKVQK